MSRLLGNQIIGKHMELLTWLQLTAIRVVPYIPCMYADLSYINILPLVQNYIINWALAHINQSSFIFINIETILGYLKSI